MSTDKLPNSIKVYARLRHKDDNDANHYSFNQLDSSLILQQPQSSKLKKSKNHSQLKFKFDHIFECKSSQQSILKKCGTPLIDQAIKGYNCTLLAYGQTGSGKTYSMLGPPSLESFNTSSKQNNNSKHGLIYRSMHELFTKLKRKDTENNQHSVIKCSFIEIYQDKMRDLLISDKNAFAQKQKRAFGKIIESETSNRLKIKTRYKNKKPSESFVANLTEEYVTNMADIEHFVGIAKERRIVCATLSNSESSRSHWVMIVTIEQTTKNSSTTVSKINFVDLAGSEKVKRSGVSGVGLQEAVNINKSLHNLRLCISALANRKAHIQYRDSTLTHLLQDSLGGNTKTSLLITLNMDKSNIEESISSCRFGCEAKNVINVAKINKRASRKQLECLVAKLQKELHRVSVTNVGMRGNDILVENSIVCSSSKDVTKMQTKLGEMEGKIKEYEETIGKLEGKKHSDQENIGNLIKLCDELKGEKESLEESMLELTDKFTKMENYNNLLQKHNVSLKENNDALQKQMVVANEQIYDLQRSINHNDRIYINVTEQNEKLNDKIDEKFEILMNQFAVVQNKENEQNEDDDSKQEYLMESLRVPTNLEVEESAIEFSIFSEPVLGVQILESYFTEINAHTQSKYEKGKKVADAQYVELQNERMVKRTMSKEAGRNKKKITPSPLRFLSKIFRLLGPQPTYESYDHMYADAKNVPRHRKISECQMNNNLECKIYGTAGNPKDCEAGY